MDWKSLAPLKGDHPRTNPVKFGEILRNICRRDACCLKKLLIHWVTMDGHHMITKAHSEPMDQTIKMICMTSEDSDERCHRSEYLLYTQWVAKGSDRPYSIQLLSGSTQLSMKLSCL